MTKETKAARISGDHRNFSRIGLLSVAAVFGGLGAFSYYAPLDSAAIATGRVAAESSNKPLQHLEGGIVREILVKESAPVKAGQVLFRLEPTQAMATADMLQKQIDAAEAQEARLAAERELSAMMTIPEALAARRSNPETAAVIADQAQQFAERRRSLENQRSILKTRVEQSAREIEGLKRQEVALEEQARSLGTEIANVSSLAKKGYYPRNKLMALERELSRIGGQLGGVQGDSAKKREAVAEAKLQIVQAEQTYREEASGKLSEVRGRLSDLTERLKVAHEIMSRVEIKAPQDGIVQGLKVLGPGAVVRPGDVLAELVPTGDKLVMAARVSPLDIESVQLGQTAEVRFASFASRQMPVILGRVERIGADTMYDEMTRQPYYAAKIVVDPATLPQDVAGRLMPGMPADVLIATGERTLLQYLMSPITDLLATSMREG